MLDDCLIYINTLCEDNTESEIETSCFFCKKLQEVLLRIYFSNAPYKYIENENDENENAIFVLFIKIIVSAFAIAKNNKFRFLSYTF